MKKVTSSDIYIEYSEKPTRGVQNLLTIFLSSCITVPPTILSSSPQSFHQPIGSTAKIFCKAEGSPKPNITWSRDGRPVTTTSRLQFQDEGREVVISNLQENDGGIFKCTFRNTVGMITQTIHLIVEG